MLCSGHGVYFGGKCRCHQGWKGLDCSVPESECEVSTCNGNGHCLHGKCKCIPGYRGEFCDEGKAVIGSNAWDLAGRGVGHGGFMGVRDPEGRGKVRLV